MCSLMLWQKFTALCSQINGFKIKGVDLLSPSMCISPQENDYVYARYAWWHNRGWCDHATRRDNELILLFYQEQSLLSYVQDADTLMQWGGCDAGLWCETVLITVGKVFWEEYFFIISLTSSAKSPQIHRYFFQHNCYSLLKSLHCI